MHPAAAKSLFVRRREPIGPFLLGSLLGHSALVGLGLVVSLVWGSRVIDLDQKPITASLVRKGKPRDQALLPRKEELPAPPLKVEGAPAAPAPAEKAPTPLPGPKPTAKSAPAQPGVANGQDRRKQLFGAFGKVGKVNPPEELEGAVDGDEEGDSATAEGERYFALLKAQGRRHYDVSDTIPEQERLRLRAQVQIKIGRAGELLEARVVKSSGNPLFDSAVLSAVKKAAPFSPPPDHLRDELQRSGVIIVYTP